MTSAFDLHLVRHGQSSWNAERRAQGQAADIPLTALGERQAGDASVRLAASGARAVYASDLLRTMATARPIAERLGVSVRTDADLREQALGEFEGWYSADVWQATDPADWANPDWRPAGGESIRDVYARVQRFLGRLRTGADGSPVVVVTHGGTAQVILGAVGGYPADKLPWAALANGEVVTVSCPAVSGPVSGPGGLAAVSGPGPAGPGRAGPPAALDGRED